MSSDTGSEYAPTVSDGESTDSDDFLADEQVTSARAAERLVVEDWEVAELVDDPCKAEEEDADVVDLVADSADEEGRVSRAGARSRKPRKPRQPRKPKPSRSDWHDLEPLPVDARLMDEAEGAEELGDEMLPCKALRQLDPSPDVITELLPYQKEFLFWAVGQEEGLIKGGILADEMGMGKTIQAISLIATHRQDGKLSRHAAPGTLPDAPGGAAAPRPALRLRGVRPAALGAAEEREGADAASPRASRGASPAAIEGALLEVSPGVSAGDREPGPPGAGEADEAAALAAARAAARLRGEHIRAERVCASSLGLHASGATLVVCPLVAVIQWKAEIERHVAPGALRVATFHGQKRTADAAALAGADVVLTTYSTLESEHRRMTQASDRLVCDHCGKRFTPARLHVHLRFFCGPHARKSEALARQERKRPRRGDQKLAEREEEEDVEEEEEEDAEEEEDLKKAAKLTGRKKATGAAAKIEKKSGAKGGKKEAASSAAASTTKASARKASQAAKKPAGRVTRATSVEPSPADDALDLSDASSDGDSIPDSDAQLMAEFMTEDGAFKDAASQAAFEMMVRQTTGAGAEASAPRSVLHEIYWRRIVLDEAHCIKDRRCSTARATFALQARYRWALSGTPLQNRVGELYSLVRFLRVSPYSYYYCRHCDCKHLDYPFRDRTRRCVSCPHGPLHHFCWWNKYVANPIKAHGYEGPGRQAMLVLKNEVLSRILLRRTKVQQADVLALPPRVVMVRRDRMDAAEEDFYEALYTQSRAQFDAYVGAGTLVNNYSHIFSLLVRLRQAVNHPYLVVHTQADAAEALHGAGAASAVAAAVVDEAVGAGGDDGADAGSCPLCHDPVEPAATARARCGHAFCRACLEEYVSAGGQACPVCAQPLGDELPGETVGGDQTAVDGAEDRAAPASTADPLADAYALPAARRPGRRKNSILARIDPARFESSTKIEALREEIQRMLARDPSAKAIVFSQFTSFLDLCAFRLQQTGVRCVQLMGSQSMAQRNAQIDAFAHDPDVRVFLMSLKAGGIALNLTAASHCFLMDPWWNPAAEWQALDRIHRLGQFKPMRAVRFIIAGSIEERIVKLQGKKQLIFEGTVGQDAGALARLTEDDLKFLFG